MSRNTALIKATVIASALVVCVVGLADADDNGMSIWTGDSYAYLNDGRNFPSGHTDAPASALTSAQTTPSRWSVEDYAAASNESAFWQLGAGHAPKNLASEADNLAFWRGHSLVISAREYVALASSSPTWRMPDPDDPKATSQRNYAPATKKDWLSSLARFFGLAPMSAKPDHP